MEQQKGKWCVGDLVTLPRKVAFIEKRGIRVYEYFSRSKYVCVRERTAEQPGLLVKLLGRCDAEELMRVNYELFSKDDKVEGFNANHYCCYRFPTADQVQEVLDIIEDNDQLRQQFEAVGMIWSPDAFYWVRNVKRKLLGLCWAPQYYNPFNKQTIPADKKSATHYRMAVVTF